MKPISQYAFVKEEAEICPACKAKNVNWHDWDETGDEANFYYECANCHAKWVAVYHLAHYDNLEVPDEDLDCPERQCPV